MSFKVPATFAVNDQLEIAFFEDHTAFVFKGDTLQADFHFEVTKDGIEIVYNDDASWADVKYTQQGLEGVLYSYLAAKKELVWKLDTSEMRDKPKAKNMLQAIRFHDLDALSAYEQKATRQQWSEMLIEASTCGHEKMVQICLEHGAILNIDESYTEDSKASSMALIKAIQYAHVNIVKQLLSAGANIHHHTFDLDKDAMYHACYLYQKRHLKAESIINVLLDHGIDFSHMSAYYLAAVMIIFPDGPLEMAKEDTKMLKTLIASGARVDDFLTINAWDKDTPLMYAAHMGLWEPLKVLIEAKANLFECYEGKNALDRAINPLLSDPQIPIKNRDRIKKHLEAFGLTKSESTDFQEGQKKEASAQAIKNDISTLSELFKTL